ncbi:MAG TPA: hypothetical protein VF661_02695 [Actinomycetales bacterium]
MSTSVQAAAASRTVEQPVWAGVRLAMLVGWVLALAAFAGLGAHPGDLDDVRRAVAAGDVRSVTVEGGLSGTGYAVQEVTWRRWGLTRTAEVLQVSPGAGVPVGVRARARSVSATEVGADLQRLDPSLQVMRPPVVSAHHYSVAGTRVPGWVAASLAGLLAGTWLLVVCAPPPWHATRWAWFWLILLPFVGPMAIALLGGPVAALRRWLLPPPRGRRPLTGGRAAFVVVFLLAFIVV